MLKALLNRELTGKPIKVKKSEEYLGCNACLAFYSKGWRKQRFYNFYSGNNKKKAFLTVFHCENCGYISRHYRSKQKHVKGTQRS
jgi:hypothetical protein